MNRRSLLANASVAAMMTVTGARAQPLPVISNTVPLRKGQGGPLSVTAPWGTSFNLDFTTGVMPAGVTFTRASSGTYFDATGTMQTAGNNVARFDYDPVTHAPRGLLIEEARTNVLLNSAVLSTQSVTVPASVQALSFYGTGTITLSGAFAGTLVGAGPFPARASLIFTPAAGTLTLTVTGSVLNAQLE